MVTEVGRGCETAVKQGKAGVVPGQLRGKERKPGTAPGSEISLSQQWLAQRDDVVAVWELSRKQI